MQIICADNLECTCQCIYQTCPLVINKKLLEPTSGLLIGENKQEGQVMNLPEYLLRKYQNQPLEIGKNPPFKS
jgi:hypothetical protein